MNRLEELRLDAQAYLELRNGATGKLFEKYDGELAKVRFEIEVVRRQGLDLFKTGGAENH